MENVKENPCKTDTLFQNEKTIQTKTKANFVNLYRNAEKALAC